MGASSFARAGCMALLVASAASGGCGDDDDDRRWDGDYSCVGTQPSGGSCHDPLVNPAFAWTLTLLGDHFEFDSRGVDLPPYGCEGHWEGDDFTCTLGWRRSGRDCSDELRIHAELDGTLNVSFGRRGWAAQCAK